MRHPIANLAARRLPIAGALIAVALAGAACTGGPASSPVAGSLGPAASQVAGSSSVPGSPGASAGASSASGSAGASAGPSALVYPVCSGPKLPARIVAWSSGAGHRTAAVQVTNAGTSPCRIRALDTPQLVDGHGSVIVNGTEPPASTPFVVLLAGAVAKSTVDVANYCGPAPDGPVTLAFVFPGGNTRFISTPLNQTDTSGVPPCLGAPGSAGTITMTAWTP